MRRSRVQFPLSAPRKSWSEAISLPRVGSERVHPRSIQDFGLASHSCGDRFANAAPACGSSSSSCRAIPRGPRPPAQQDRPRHQARCATGAGRAGQRGVGGQLRGDPYDVGELLERWLEHVDDHLSPTTVREYRRLAAKFCTRPRHACRCVASRPTRSTATTGGSPTSAGSRRPRSVTSTPCCGGALGQAVRWGWLPGEPGGHRLAAEVRRREIQPPPISRHPRSARGRRGARPRFRRAAPRARRDGRAARRSVRAPVVRPRPRGWHGGHPPINRVRPRRHRREGHQDPLGPPPRPRPRDDRRRSAPAHVDALAVHVPMRRRAGRLRLQLDARTAQRRSTPTP